MMRIAVISDIHGNAVALDAVLADLRAESYNQLVCLGDAIQGGPQPAQVVARLRELDCPVVMGNADYWLLTGEDTSGREAVTEKQLAVRVWSLSQLSKDDRDFIARFRPTVEMALEGERKLLCFHGSPRSFDDIILPETPEEEFCAMLGAFVPAIMTGGHTHLQQIRRIEDTFFFNPGSVGLAYNRYQPEENFRVDAWAEYAVISTEGGRVRLEFRRMPFDVNELIRIYRESGIPFAESSLAQYAGK